MKLTQYRIVPMNLALRIWRWVIPLRQAVIQGPQGILKGDCLNDINVTHPLGSLEALSSSPLPADSHPPTSPTAPPDRSTLSDPAANWTDKLKKKRRYRKRKCKNKTSDQPPLEPADLPSQVPSVTQDEDSVVTQNEGSSVTQIELSIITQSDLLTTTQSEVSNTTENEISNTSLSEIHSLTEDQIQFVIFSERTSELNRAVVAAIQALNDRQAARNHWPEIPERFLDPHLHDFLSALDRAYLGLGPQAEIRTVRRHRPHIHHQEVIHPQSHHVDLTEAHPSEL
jgi:hypothetical protein